MSHRFTKPALGIGQQIAHPESAGMSVADHPSAEQWLKHVSYYRLSGYWHIWKDRTNAGETRFLPGATLDASRAGHAAGQLYNALVLLLYLVRQVSPGSTWSGELITLLKAHPAGDLGAMRFPVDWIARPLWT